MEKRREPRFETDQQISVCVLADAGERVSGRVTDFSGKGLGLVLDAGIPPGTAVKVETDDILLLAEVVYCAPDGAKFKAGLELQHALYHLKDLGRLSAALLAEGNGKLREGQRAHTGDDRSR